MTALWQAASGRNTSRHSTSRNCKREGPKSMPNVASYGWGRVFSFFLGVLSLIVVGVHIVLRAGPVSTLFLYSAAAILGPFLYKRKQVAVRTAAGLSAIMVLRFVLTLLSAASITPVVPIAFWSFNLVYFYRRADLPIPRDTHVAPLLKDDASRPASSAQRDHCDCT